MRVCIYMSINCYVTCISLYTAMYCRVKSDVMTEVPVKVEKMIFCPISRLQVKLINELRDYVTSEVGH